MRFARHVFFAHNSLVVAEGNNVRMFVAYIGDLHRMSIRSGAR